ncbi:helix-turn-helix domain-containing protein [Streptomyces roseolus]|uniref:helix-turn-helix domain-containing protein n=1 Tax=Streptomyces roseolus TaxID=67358 RepID=UPI00378ED4A6
MVHETTRHTRDFTVITNRLLQHPTIGGVAIAVGCHMMSVAEGTSVTIRCLADRLGFSRQKVADALHALEEHGYLRRTVIRTAGGRLITRTVICHSPGAPASAPDRPAGRPRPRKPGPAPEPVPAPSPPSTRAATPTTPRSLPSVPRPGFPAQELLRAALHVLIDLRNTNPRLYVSEAEAEHLTPGVAAWLERGVPPEAVRDALASDLPGERLRRPAAFLAHRLTAKLPPAPPLTAPPPTKPTAPTTHPLLHCETCDTCFRAPEATPCPSCKSPDTTPAAYQPPRC